MRSKVSSHLATREESQYIHKMLYHCPKFDQKGYFRSKTGKLSITIEFTRNSLWGTFQFKFLDEICRKGTSLV